MCEKLKFNCYVLLLHWKYKKNHTQNHQQFNEQKQLANGLRATNFCIKSFNELKLCSNRMHYFLLFLHVLNTRLTQSPVLAVNLLLYQRYFNKTMSLQPYQILNINRAYMLNYCLKHLASSLVSCGSWNLHKISILSFAILCFIFRTMQASWVHVIYSIENHYAIQKTTKKNQTNHTVYVKIKDDKNLMALCFCLTDYVFLKSFHSWCFLNDLIWERGFDLPHHWPWQLLPRASPDSPSPL